MRQPQYSPQDLDPIGGLTARMMTIALGIAALAVAVGMLAASSDQVSNPPAQAGALLSIGLAAGTLFWFSNPYRAPFGRAPAIAFFTFCVLAVALDALSQAGSNTSVRDDWPPISIALLLLMIGSYRPARETLQLVVVTVLAIGLIAVAGSTSHPPLQIGLVVITIVTPVVAGGLASVVFSHRVVAALLAWRQESVSAQRDTIDGMRSDLIPSVRAARLELLETEVLPFLRQIVENGVLTAECSDRSRDLAAGLRDVMSPDSGGNWLEELADSVDDPERLLERMGAEQRGSLRALLVELRTSGHVVAGSTRVTVYSQDHLAQAVISAEVTEPASLRARLAPYFAVARGFLLGATMHIDQEHLLLEFRFEAA